MIYLASSSPTRAKILKDNGVEFTRIPFNFDESGISKDDARTYAYRVVLAKKTQFLKFIKIMIECCLPIVLCLPVAKF